MRMSALCTAVVTYVVVGHPPPAVAQVDQQRAQDYFKEVQAVCDREGKRLWGMSMCGPMVIADLRTQTIATSQPAPEGNRPRLDGRYWLRLEWRALARALRESGEQRDLAVREALAFRQARRML